MTVMIFVAAGQAVINKWHNLMEIWDSCVVGHGLENNDSRGILFYIASGIEVSLVEIPSAFQDCLFLMIRRPESNGHLDQLLIGNVYRNPSSTQENDIELYKLLSTHASAPTRFPAYMRRPLLVKPTAVCCSSAAAKLHRRRQLLRGSSWWQMPWTVHDGSLIASPSHTPLSSLAHSTYQLTWRRTAWRVRKWRVRVLKIVSLNTDTHKYRPLPNTSIVRTLLSTLGSVKNTEWWTTGSPSLVRSP